MKFGKKKDKENKENGLNSSNSSNNGTPTNTNNNISKKEKEKEKKKTKKSNSSGNLNNLDGKSGKVFGAALPPDGEEIPDLIVQTIDYLEHFGLDTPGIFRESGSVQQIQHYKTLYDQNKPVSFTPYEPHVVASLLKLYLRELKDPLLTFEHYDMFVACESINDEKVKVEVIKKVFKSLPLYNLKIIKYICNFLLKVVEHSEHNKMSPDTLSIVFLPTVLRPHAQNDQQVLQYTVEDSKSTKTLMSSILLNYDYIFEDPTLLQPKTRQTRAATEFVVSPSSSKNTSPYSPLSPSTLSPATLSPLTSPGRSIPTTPTSQHHNNHHIHHYHPSAPIDSPFKSPLPPPPIPLPQQQQQQQIPQPTPPVNTPILSPSQPPPLPSLSTLPPPPLPIKPLVNNNIVTTGISKPPLPLPPKPPSLVVPTLPLPPKPIPKLPSPPQNQTSPSTSPKTQRKLFEVETRQRSNTTAV
eukprot:gene5433-6777_t